MRERNTLKKYVLIAIFFLLILSNKINTYAVDTSVNSVAITHTHSGNSLTGGGCYTINNTTTQSITNVLGYKSATGGNQISLGSYDLTNVTNVSATYITDPYAYNGSHAYTVNLMKVHLSLGGSTFSNALKTQVIGQATGLGDPGTYYMDYQAVISTSVSWDVSNITGTHNLYTNVEGVGINYNFSHNINLTSLTLTNTRYDLGCGHTNGQQIATFELIKKFEDGKYKLVPLATSEDSIFTPVSYTWNNGDNGTCIVTGNGTYTSTLTYLDYGTQKTVTLTYEVTDFDIEPPTINSNYDNSIWKNSSILEIQATDLGVGLANEPYSFDGGLTWISDNTLAITGNATYTVLVRDLLGNIGTYIINITNIDSISPTSSILYENGSFVKTSILTIVAEDMQSGLPAEPYSFDGGVTWVNESTYSIIKNGIYEVLVRDNAGNISTISQSITNIDTIAPTVIIPYDNSTYVKLGTLNIQASDFESGLSVEPYSFDGGNTWTNQVTYSVTSNGNYDILVQDQAGNITSILIEVTNIDTTSPVANILYDNMIFVKTGQIEVQASDLESGLPAEPYSFDGGVTWVNESTYPIIINGTYIILVRDTLGNTSTLTVVVSNIDSVSPIVAVIYDNNVYVKSGTLNIQASDLESGLPAEPYSFDGGLTWVSQPIYSITSNGIYNLWVRDLIGNITEYSITITNIDTSIPIIETKEEVQESAIIVTIEANDLDSGLSEKPYSYDQGATWTDKPEITITESGTYDVMVKDKVGNIAKETVTVEIPEVVEELVIIEESNIPFQQFFGTTVSTTGTGIFFMLFIFIFSSAGIYKKDKDGKWVSLAKVRIKKKKGNYIIDLDFITKRKIKRDNIQELQIICSKFFVKNNISKNVELIYNNKKYIIVAGEPFVIKL